MKSFRDRFDTLDSDPIAFYLFQGTSNWVLHLAFTVLASMSVGIFTTLIVNYLFTPEFLTAVFGIDKLGYWQGVWLTAPFIWLSLLTRGANVLRYTQG